MKRIFAPFVIATIFASVSASAFALSFSDQYGSSADSRFMTRTIVIDSHTRYLNVQHGETVTIRDGKKKINWTFDGLSTSFDLAKILPPVADTGHMVQVYIAPEPLN